MKAFAVVLGLSITASLAWGISAESGWWFAVPAAVLTMTTYTLLISLIFKPDAANRQPRP